MKEGLIHIYTGDGKGKTTAAVGLTARMAGSGGRAVFCQFLKGDQSGERKALAQIAGVTVMDVPPVVKFIWNMTEEEKAETARACARLFVSAAALARDADLLVLDEALGAIQTGMLAEDTVIQYLKTKPRGLEVVLTGRDPSEALVSMADYVSEIALKKHPYERGVPARKGVEF